MCFIVIHCDSLCCLCLNAYCSVKLTCKINIKGHSYGCQETEDRRTCYTSTNSYFRIHGSHLSQSDTYTNRWLYGRILFFMSVSIGPPEHRLELQMARVDLYKAAYTTTDPAMNLHRVQDRHADSVYDHIKYITLNMIDAPVLIARCASKAKPPKHGSSDAGKPAVSYFVAMLATSDPTLGMTCRPPME